MMVFVFSSAYTDALLQMRELQLPKLPPGSASQIRVQADGAAANVLVEVR